MSTRAEDRPGRSHVPPTPLAKLAPADDPAWAHTLALAALAREARPTTTNEETTMADTPAKGLEWIADRLDQLNANAVTMFEDIDERTGNGEDIDSDTDELRHQSIGASIAYGTAAQMIRAALAPPTSTDDTRTLEWNGVTVTIGTSTGRDGAALVIMDGFLDDGAIDVATVERFEADRAHAGNLDEHEALMNYLRHHVGRGPVDGWAEWDEAPTFPTDGSTEAAP